MSGAARTGLSRRGFVGASIAIAAGASKLRGQEPPKPQPEGTTSATQSPDPIIDIHQHTNYAGRTDEQLIFHQQRMGVTQTIMLPAGRPVDRPSTNNGKSNGLAAKTGTNETCLKLVRDMPGKYYFFANEVPDIPEARTEIEKYLKLGALGIGEQKFDLDCDSAPMQGIFEIAQQYNVPVLMHFQYNNYNRHFERLGGVLEKWPKVRIIGHAQTMWANIDKDWDEKKGLYPKGKVTPGGLTDQYLEHFPNFFADMSAGSGLNALNRDHDHAKWFLEKHQDKILYGSDCNDAVGRPPACQGALTIAAIRTLARREVERKILYLNSKKMFGI